MKDRLIASRRVNVYVVSALSASIAALALPTLGLASPGAGPSGGAWDGRTGTTAPPTQSGDRTVSATGSGITIVSHASGFLRNQVRFTGSVAAGDAGQVVEIERRGHETNWTWAATAHSTVASDGSFSVVWRANHIGRFAFRAILQSAVGPASRRRVADGHGHRLPLGEGNPVRPWLLRQAHGLRRQADPQHDRARKPHAALRRARLGLLPGPHAVGSRDRSRPLRQRRRLRPDDGNRARSASAAPSRSEPSRSPQAPVARLSAAGPPHRPRRRRRSSWPRARRPAAASARGPPRCTPTPSAAAASLACSALSISSSLSEPSSPSTATPMLTVSGAPRQACAIRTEPAVRAAERLRARPGRVPRDDPRPGIRSRRPGCPGGASRRARSARTGRTSRRPRSAAQPPAAARPLRARATAATAANPSAAPGSARGRARRSIPVRRRPASPAPRSGGSGRLAVGSGAPGSAALGGCGGLGSGRRCVPGWLAGALDVAPRSTAERTSPMILDSRSEISASRSGSSSRSSDANRAPDHGLQRVDGADARLGGRRPRKLPRARHQQFELSVGLDPAQVGVVGERADDRLADARSVARQVRG